MAGNIPCYQPWSPYLWQFVRRNAWSGKFYLLDVQLGSDCNARCGKCDSSCCELREPAKLDIDAVAKIACEMYQNFAKACRAPSDPFKLQGFVCGLGEPTAGENLQKLKDLVNATKDYGFNWAFFNNGLYWDDELDAMLRSGFISVQVQCNGDDVATVMKEMGITEKAAESQIAHRKALYQVALARRVVDVLPGTNVCISLVPTTDNSHLLWNWFVEGISYNVFPLIGELEQAGLCQGEQYEQQRLTQAELSALKKRIWDELRWDYKVPYCPATIGAVHINNRNLVTITEKTGLSCGWPAMKGAGDLVMGDIRMDSLDRLSKSILAYRMARVEMARELVYQMPHMVFGGCGGNVRYLLQDYVASYDEFLAAGGG